MLILLVTAGSITILYILALFLVARASIYPPRVPEFISPGQMGLPQENVEFPSRDGHRLSGWWVPGEEDLVVICAHGYMMNRCEFVPMARALAESGASLLFFDFRAHGQSDRTKCTIGPNESRDVLGAIDYAETRCPGAQIAILGSSMGAAASVLATVEEPSKVDGLILDGLYRSLHEAGKGWWLFLGGRALQSILGPTIIFGRMLTGVSPKQVRIDLALGTLAGKPILIFNGTADPIVPVSSAQANFDSAGSNAHIEWFEGAGHGNPRFREPVRYEQLVRAFLCRIRQGISSNPATSEPEGSS